MPPTRRLPHQQHDPQSAGQEQDGVNGQGPGKPGQVGYSTEKESSHQRSDATESPEQAHGNALQSGRRDAGEEVYQGWPSQAFTHTPAVQKDGQAQKNHAAVMADRIPEQGKIQRGLLKSIVGCGFSRRPAAGNHLFEPTFQIRA